MENAESHGGHFALHPNSKRAPQRADPRHQANLTPDRPRFRPGSVRRAGQRPT